MNLNDTNETYCSEMVSGDEHTAQSSRAADMVVVASRTEVASRSKAAITVPETETLVASVERFEVAYDVLGGDRIDGERGFSDESRITVFATITAIGRKHRHLLGRLLEFTIICSRTFCDHKAPLPSSDPKFLLSLNFSKDGCSAGMYLDGTPFWATPALLASHAYGRIELGYKRWPRYRNARLEHVSFMSVADDAE